MEASVNSLPSEILEIIFSHCTHSDLVQSIQNVCCRRREVAQSTSLWKNVTYSPEEDTRSEQVVEMLMISPKLQNIVLKYKCDGRVLQTITDNCPELRKLEIRVFPFIEMNFIMNLQEKCPKLQYLKIPHPVVTGEVVGNFTNLKVLHLRGDPLAGILMKFKPLADHCKELEDLEFWTNRFEVNDLRYLLSTRKDTLQNVGVSCCNESGECVLPALSTCELKSLSVFNYCHCQRHYEKIEHFGRLKTVRTLSISYFHSENESDDHKQIFENKNMAQLVELKIQDSHYFDDNATEVIVRNCPLLKCLSLIQCYKISDASLTIMPTLKELKCLTVSDNSCVTDAGVAHLQHVTGLKCRRMSWWEKLES